MAAISLIAGSVLGWVAAALALFTGAFASTALIIFLFTSLAVAGTILGLAGAKARAD
jgi:hypothetical protein